MDELEVKADAEIIADLATKAAELRPVALGDHGALGVLVPEGFGLTVLEADRFTEHPDRKAGTVSLSTADALAAYVTRHQTDGTELYVEPLTGRTVAVLDDHAEGHAGRGGHRAVFQPIVTDEWKAWELLDGDLVDQIRFAEHVQDNGKEITEPTPAEMLELATTFHAKSKVQFRQVNNLTNGAVQVLYDEDTEAQAGAKGKLDIPTTFQLAIAPFVGETRYAVTARLRWRLNAGQLRLGYQLDRPDDIVRDAVKGIADRLSEAFPNVYLGTPRS